MCNKYYTGALDIHSQLSLYELIAQPIIPSTVRLSIGTEHIDDLLADLGQALDRFSKLHLVSAKIG